MFKVGDKVLTIDPWFGNALLIIDDFRECEGTYYAIFSDGGFFRVNALRTATRNEITAGYRAGSKEFDLYWYGQSEADAIKEYEGYQEDLIQGGESQ
ncbi:MULTISPECIES: hypothetical protein [unclassified Acinetobacter]|uniref:hypothetical protein n=1 Tax=unclassified Acinetobacter TaxID=196816 RepID=UPI00244D0AC5|nr:MULTISPECIES: hypothetical protein [unclassified Acinetobacter]MDH0032030.1 hypothetical protein [Acinetobacter sp. GD04021]MDH0887686.1 hypothetical protein [Acinetobacter sp. GD03873]MDH1084034.1 hypothetical protein [Acinetobacter sp. GD03983]MDH2191039.1 hypothetical protein [Acinetobacter sp. GD03645]MDH2204546.1 hypothetical protein [Acinetobacter sp. GD03647]